MSTRAGGCAKVQYPQVSLHRNVSGMNTFGLKVIRVPCTRSRIAAASVSSDSVVSCSSRWWTVIGILESS